MTFLSWQVWAGLGLAVILAWALPRRWQPLGIAAITAGFMAFFSPVSLVILALFTAGACGFAGYRQATPALVAPSIGVVVAVVVAFKCQPGLEGKASLLPLGLSYYSFRLIHYLLEAYKRRLPLHGPEQVICYLFFLPTLLVGPIHRFDTFVRDLRRRRLAPAALSAGFERILIGFLKVTVLAGYLINEKLFLWIQAVPAGSVGKICLEAWSGWLDLYFQFSGCSDIAIGFGALMGFRVMENFDSPWRAPNIRDYWLRWHISLTTWCRDYVFAPMLAFSRRPFLSVFGAMIVLGLWHELSLRYILWGVYHALGLALWHRFQGVKPWLRRRGIWLPAWPARIAGIGLTLNFVVLSYPLTTLTHGKILGIFKTVMACMR